VLQTLFDVPFCLHQPHIHVNGNNSKDCNRSGEALSISDLEGFTRIGAHTEPNTRLILVKPTAKGFNEHKDMLQLFFSHDTTRQNRESVGIFQES
jgi:hypothetical protein